MSDVERRAEAVMRKFALIPTQFWSRADMLALVLEIERLRRELAPTPEPTFWLGADACAP